MKNLSEKQIGDLAQVAVAQEHLLTNLSGQIELKSGVQVGKTAFNVVRKPIIQLHAQEYKVFPKIKNAKFLYLSKLDDASKLTYEEKKTLGDLGIKKDQTAVVQFDTTAIRSLMGKVGDKLKVTEFKGKIFD
jgi:ribosomal protein L30/L7E